MLDREFCNAGSRCDARHWLGRGQESVPGKPFGWARMMQDIALCQWQRSRGIDPTSGAAYFQRSRMHMRLERDYHRRKPPIGVRRIAAAPERAAFTREQLERIAERFATSNDEPGQGIAALARKLAERNAT